MVTMLIGIYASMRLSHRILTSDKSGNFSCKFDVGTELVLDLEVLVSMSSCIPCFVEYPCNNKILTYNVNALSKIQSWVQNGILHWHSNFKFVIVFGVLVQETIYIHDVWCLVLFYSTKCWDHQGMSINVERQGVLSYFLYSTYLIPCHRYIILFFIHVVHKKNINQIILRKKFTKERRRKTCL